MVPVVYGMVKHISNNTTKCPQHKKSSIVGSGKGYLFNLHLKIWPNCSDRNLYNLLSTAESIKFTSRNLLYVYQQWYSYKPNATTQSTSTTVDPNVYVRLSQLGSWMIARHVSLSRGRIPTGYNTKTGYYSIHFIVSYKGFSALCDSGP